MHVEALRTNRRSHFPPQPQKPPPLLCPLADLGADDVVGDGSGLSDAEVILEKTSDAPPSESGDWAGGGLCARPASTTLNAPLLWALATPSIDEALTGSAPPAVVATLHARRPPPSVCRRSASKRARSSSSSCCATASAVLALASSSSSESSFSRGGGGGAASGN